MTKTQRVRLIYGIILGIALVVAGICLIGACICIYHSGDKPFSREAVAFYFSEISVPVYLALALTAGGFILSFALPKEKSKKPGKNLPGTLRRLWEKRDITLLESQLQADIRKQQMSRKLHTYISIGLLSIGSLLFLAYAVDPDNFPSEDITGSMAKGTVIMLICLFVPFVYAVLSSYLARASMKKEIELVRSVAPNRQTSLKSSEKSAGNVLRWVLLGVAVLSIVYGYFAGGTVDVLTKAVNICTECVGLG